MNRKKSKSADESAVEMRMLVMPNDTNPHSTIFGGKVMSWIDMAAAMAAERHCNRPVVTVHIDDIDFLAPIKIGDHAVIKAKINWVGKSSLLVGVKVWAENPITGDTRHTTTAYLTFVALNDVGRPVEIPQLEIKTDEDKRRYEEAKQRVDEQRQKRQTKKA